MEFYKKSNSVLWTLFQTSPELFNEVKGEWSLSKITGLIHSKGIHLDVDLASKYYLLSKDATEKISEVEEGSKFFGYKKYTKIWKEEDEEVVSIIQLLKNLIKSIKNQDAFLYPPIQSYHYAKYLNVKKMTIHQDKDNGIYLFSFNLDDITEEIEKAESLLLNSKSGHQYFQVDIDEGDIEIYDEEKDTTDKVPGKIVNHRTVEDGQIELLMKWKYLSYDESTWIKYEQYKHLYVVKMYCLKNLFLQ